MGRPRKQTADYFPHYVADSRTKFILEDGWGNDGYAFWFKLLELLCKSDGHYYDLSSSTDKKYLTALAKVSEATAFDIMDMLADLGKIDKELWNERKIVWCQTLVDNLSMLYSKRTVSAPEKPTLEDLEARTPDEENIPNTENCNGNPQEIAAEDVKSEPVADGEKPKGKPRKREKEVEPDKVKYAEFVSMTEEEHEKLVTSHGKEKTARMIEVLDNYKGSKGTTYKSDYRAILNWVVERVNEEFTKKGAGSYGGFAADRQDTKQNFSEFKPSTGVRRG